MDEQELLFDEEEFQRWLGQAQHTLRSAQNDMENADYNWCCFKSQQAAEYALKALLRGVGRIAVGHSTLALLEVIHRMGASVAEDLRKCARSLDRHYIPARYPDAYPSGAPYEFYDQSAAQEALKCAGEIVAFVNAEKERYVQGAATETSAEE